MRVCVMCQEKQGGQDVQSRVREGEWSEEGVREAVGTGS